jgi:hypothetical protein
VSLFNCVADYDDMVKKSDESDMQCPNLPVARLNFYKRHVLADSGINLIHQRTITAERLAVLDFHQSLPNARLQWQEKSISRGVGSWIIYGRRASCTLSSAMGAPKKFELS